MQVMNCPSHLQSLECVRGMEGVWDRYIPSRLSDTKLADRKQLWYIHPNDWTEQSAYIKAHEEEVNRLASEGGIGVLIYDLSKSSIPTQWTSVMVPHAEMHQRLHQNGSYEKWLVQTFIVVPNEIVYTALNAVLTGAWKPTRPLSVVFSMQEVDEYVRKLWRPRT